jgi:hypothetical protein
VVPTGELEAQNVFLLPDANRDTRILQDLQLVAVLQFADGAHLCRERKDTAVDLPQTYCACLLPLAMLVEDIPGASRELIGVYCKTM